MSGVSGQLRRDGEDGDWGCGVGRAVGEEMTTATWGGVGKERGKAPETSHGCDTPGPPLEALSQNMHDLLVLLQLILGMLRSGTYGTDHWIRAGLARGATIYVLLLLNTKHYKHV